VEHGVYIAADYGNFKFGRTAAGFDADLEPFLECSFATDLACASPADVVFSQSSLTRKAHGYDVWVGYQFSPWFAVEGAYLSLGKTRHSVTGTIDQGPVDVDGDGNVDYSGPQPVQVETSFKTGGPAVAATGSLPLGSYVSLDARAGFFFPDNKLSLRMQITPEGSAAEMYSFTQSKGKTALFYGASANFWITPYFGVRAGYFASSKGSFDHSIKQYFVGIRYSYGY